MNQDVLAPRLTRHRLLPAACRDFLTPDQHSLSALLSQRKSRKTLLPPSSLERGAERSIRKTGLLGLECVRAPLQSLRQQKGSRPTLCVECAWKRSCRKQIGTNPRSSLCSPDAAKSADTDTLQKAIWRFGALAEILIRSVRRARTARMHSRVFQQSSQRAADGSTPRRRRPRSPATSDAECAYSRRVRPTRGRRCARQPTALELNRGLRERIPVRHRQVLSREERDRTSHRWPCVGDLVHDDRLRRC